MSFSYAQMGTGNHTHNSLKKQPQKITIKIKLDKFSCVLLNFHTVYPQEIKGL
ncbi:hypothetical protein SYNPCC7002_B0002 (plasmid) [Picosynechococcus sp. PCC 7002]|nr:hypothetical protein SYNPCC7002_B0002 [Picosynechococcus sp. PCC 7002]BAA03081.1 ORF 3 [Picosynechococcus sp. PCC 7002]